MIIAWRSARIAVNTVQPARTHVHLAGCVRIAPSSARSAAADASSVLLFAENAANAATA